MRKIVFIAVAAAAMCACAETSRKAAPVEGGETITLSVPAREDGASINEALWERRSWREYSSEPLSLEELSGVMWAAAGVNREDGHLTSPSAMALYPVRTYAFLESGVYLYEAAAKRLLRVVEGDFRALATLQDFASEAALNIVYIADTAAYDGRDIAPEQMRMLCGMDAAGYAENVNLYAAGHGLRAITRGGAHGAQILSLLGLDTERYFFVLAQTVGK